MTQTLRRPMTAALRTADLPPEMLAFVKAGTPQPQIVSVTKDSSVQLEPAPSRTLESTAAIPPQIEAEERLKPMKPRAVREPEPVAHPGLVSLSIRVPTEVPEGLVRASAERKIKRLRPWTQQEIAAEAITQWLKRNGYSG